MKVTLDDIRDGESRHVLQTYRRQPVAFVRGSGTRLYDVYGREYLDFVSGIGVTSLGHAHPGLSAAIAASLLACMAMRHRRWSGDGSPNTNVAPLSAWYPPRLAPMPAIIVSPGDGRRAMVLPCGKAPRGPV